MKHGSNTDLESLSVLQTLNFSAGRADFCVGRNKRSAVPAVRKMDDDLNAHAGTALRLFRPTLVPARPGCVSSVAVFDFILPTLRRRGRIL
jgi:hypothetical protein